MAPLRDGGREYSLECLRMDNKEGGKNESLGLAVTN
jgi:hypothetical protein